MQQAGLVPIDLVVDLNSEDDSGLPWTFVDEALDPGLKRPGAFFVPKSGIFPKRE